jgi:hypothetical protein
LAYIKILFQLLSGGNEENQEKTQVTIGALLRIKLTAITVKERAAFCAYVSGNKCAWRAGGKTPTILNSAFRLI